MTNHLPSSHGLNDLPDVEIRGRSSSPLVIPSVLQEMESGKTHQMAFNPIGVINSKVGHLIYG
jgi:hypothetical protein